MTVTQWLRRLGLVAVLIGMLAVAAPVAAPAITAERNACTGLVQLVPTDQFGRPIPVISLPGQPFPVRVTGFVAIGSTERITNAAVSVIDDVTRELRFQYRPAVGPDGLIRLEDNVIPVNGFGTVGDIFRAFAFYGTPACGEVLEEIAWFRVTA